MSNGLTSFVPVLTGPNYLQWAPKMQAFLQTTGRWMQPMTKTCPTLVATPSNQDKVDAWNEDDTAARGSIRLRVDDSIGTAINSKTTAKQVWDYLKDTYGKPGIPVVYQDFCAAMGISIPSDSNPIPAMDKLRAHFQTLETNQFTVAEHIKGMILLSKLPSAMDPIIQVYTSGLTAMQTTPAVQLVTFDEVRNHVIMYWEQRQGRHQQKPRDSVNKISAVKRKPQDPTFRQQQQRPQGQQQHQQRPYGQQHQQQRPQGQQQQGYRGRRGGRGRSQQHQGAHQHAHIAHVADTFPVITKGEMDTLPQSRDPRALLHKPVRAETGANHQYPALRRAFTLAKELGVEPTTERIRKLEMLVVAGNRSKDPVLTPTTELHSTRSSPESSATYSEDSRTTSPSVSCSPTPFAGSSVRIVEVDSGEDTDGEEHAAKRRRRTLKERIRPHLRERIGVFLTSGVMAGDREFLAPRPFHRPGDVLAACGGTRDVASMDEAHCISQWGGDFRPDYSQLSVLRTFVPQRRAPIAAFSATMAPGVISEVEESLLINPATSFYLNLGNNRANIYLQVFALENSLDFAALDALLPLGTVSRAADVPKTIIFANSRRMTLRIWSYLCEKLRLPVAGRLPIAFLHAYRRQRARVRVMDAFVSGEVRILVATEAAGMGADIPDIEHAIHFGAPPSLTTWIQRAGRAGRSPRILARATLLIEKSAFQLINRKGPRKPKKQKTSTAESATTATEKGPEYRKKIDRSLRVWLDHKGCRREAVDEYFNNPILTARSVKRPRSSSSSAPSVLSPSKRRRDNIPMEEEESSGQIQVEVAPRRIRAGGHRERAIAALKSWRLEMVRTRYKLTSFSEEGLLSDDMIASLVYDATLKSVEDVIRKLADPPWVFAPRHAKDVLAVLASVDAAHDAAQASKVKPSALRGRSARSTALTKRVASENDENIHVDVELASPFSGSSPSSPQAPIPSDIPSSSTRAPKPRPRYRADQATSPQVPLTPQAHAVGADGCQPCKRPGHSSCERKQ
ncbi:transporter [Ganoderma sinense ZZ0214-1]|uniref:DNA 3'-5' helicase n=1 Tax=Ganoderma sinense ZZ0214-1 TaxID=1077348 RepID=A0A2G8S347_9APHY|nr:transporter [Ganoderma sinense ZZ0214-1]